ncbi:MAG: hypothetical protein KBD63_07455, partial [Bacteriovoracaceae bacterium]|nr:hypothetical protein [Bacteriovoracaceae bacterium]
IFVTGYAFENQSKIVETLEGCEASLDIDGQRAVLSDSKGCTYHACQREIKRTIASVDGEGTQVVTQPTTKYFRQCYEGGKVLKSVIKEISETKFSKIKDETSRSIAP